MYVLLNVYLGSILESGGLHRKLKYGTLKACIP